MLSLFPAENIYPEGFIYMPGFISVDEELQLLAFIEKIELHNFTFQGYIANRRVASFGWVYSFNDAKLTKGADIPAAFDFLLQRASEKMGVRPDEIAELLVTQYPPGAVINWHRDAPPFDVVAGISLNADCTFRLRPYDRSKQQRSSVVSLKAERRSFYIMKGEARSAWQHSIMPVKETRYSITMRTLRR